MISRVFGIEIHLSVPIISIVKRGVPKTRVR
jgi:hypothetical protein